MTTTTSNEAIENVLKKCGVGRILDQATKTALGEPKEVRVSRTGELDLQFRGWQVGFGDTGNGPYRSDWTRGTKVWIWITTGAQIVTDVETWSNWEGETTRYRAAAHRDAESALSWLRLDSHTEDHLGPASKEAWEAACENVPSLEGLDVELVA